jgi:hypothetical protein
MIHVTGIQTVFLNAQIRDVRRNVKLHIVFEGNCSATAFGALRTISCKNYSISSRTSLIPYTYTRNDSKTS